MALLVSCGGSSSRPDADEDIARGDADQVHTVAIIAGEGGTLYPSGSVEVHDGQRLRVSIVPLAGYETSTVTGCNGSLSEATYVTAPVVHDCDIQATFSAIPEVTVSLAVSGDGIVTPSESQTTRAGHTVTFALEPRIDGCSIALSGDCSFSHDETSNEVSVTPQSDCSLLVDFDCGPSTLQLRPEHVGVFWENRTQQFSATQIFASGEEVDVTDIVQWHSSDDTIASIDPTGLATALVDAGIVDISAQIPESSVSTETTLTVVHVTEWADPSLEAVLDYATGRVYLDSVVFTQTVLSWYWEPRDWEPDHNNVSGRIWAIWSENGGSSYKALAWDWIGNDTFSKGRADRPSYSPWMGTMLASLCDIPGSSTCNARERTNIYFTVGYGY